MAKKTLTEPATAADAIVEPATAGDLIKALVEALGTVPTLPADPFAPVTKSLEITLNAFGGYAQVRLLSTDRTLRSHRVAIDFPKKEGDGD